MNKKKIAYFCSGYPGVSHTFIFREIMELRKSGLEIFTAAVNPLQWWPEMSVAEKGEAKKTFYIKETSLLKIVWCHLLIFAGSPARYTKTLFRTLKFMIIGAPLVWCKAAGYFVEAGIFTYWLKKNRIAHIHVHFLNPAATVVLVTTEMHAVEFSLSAHGPDIFYNTDSNLLAEKIRGAKFVRCISHYCQSQLMRLVPHKQWEKLRIVRCGVNTNDFAPDPWPNNNISQILCVGRLTKNKGQHILLHSCAGLKQDGLNIHLTLIGDGEDRDSLEKLADRLGIKELVTFTGWVGQERIREHYRRADLFVLPSFAEGVPVVLMEAMAMGVPVISTQIAGIPELIRDKENGFLVFPSDIKGLTEKIKILSSNKEIRERFIQKARLTVKAEYEIGRNCRGLREIFEEEI